MSPRTLVFSGPTLSGLADFRNSVADRFVFHSPVRCGNLLEAQREGYKKAVIIDGFFEAVPAVWHKEILEFMDKGGIVIGCSSMGALRAIELERYGMLGFGNIVEDFRAGKLLDDDEVTIAHLGQAQDFVPLSDAMVNIRYTIQDAVQNNALGQEDAEKILNAAKLTFYKKRILKLLAREVLKEGPGLDRFQEYLASSGIIDQKRNDALALLTNMDVWLEAELNKNRTIDSEPLSNSGALQTIKYIMSIQPPALEKQVLAPESRFLKMGRLLIGKQYHLTVKLAGAMMHFSNAVKTRPPAEFLPVSWVSESWFEGDEKLLNLFASALQICPQYRDGRDIPMRVRSLCFSLEFPVEYLNLAISESHGESFSTNSISNYSRLFFLLGLFLDARLALDPFAKRVAPAPKAVELKMAEYSLRGYESEEEQRAFLMRFGLENLFDAVTELERNSMLLKEAERGPHIGFLEEGINWFRKAAQASGIWRELLSLSKKEVRLSFSEELSEDLKKLKPVTRVQGLLLSGLPSHLLEVESLVKYIGDQLD